MKPPGRTIFRPQALRRYNERRENAVFPKFVLPRRSLPLWILFGLLAVALVIASLTEIPVYARGMAVEIEREGGPRTGPPGMIAILPAESLPDLKVGQKVFIRRNERDGMMRGEVSEIIPGLLSSADINSRFNLNVESSAQPKTVAVISLIGRESGEGLRHSRERTDLFSEVLIEVGARHLLSSLVHRG